MLINRLLGIVFILALMLSCVFGEEAGTKTRGDRLIESKNFYEGKFHNHDDVVQQLYNKVIRVSKFSNNKINFLPGQYNRNIWLSFCSDHTVYFTEFFFKNIPEKNKRALNA